VADVARFSCSAVGAATTLRASAATAMAVTLIFILKLGKEAK